MLRAVVLATRAVRSTRAEGRYILLVEKNEELGFVLVVKCVLEYVWREMVGEEGRLLGGSHRPLFIHGDGEARDDGSESRWKRSYDGSES